MARKSQFNEYVKLFHDGSSFAEIAQKCGVSRQAVHKELKKHGIIKIRKLTHSEASKLASLIEADWNAGRSKLYMSRKYKLQQAYIVEYARKTGCSPRPLGKEGMLFEQQAIRKEKIMFHYKKLRCQYRKNKK